MSTVDQRLQALEKQVEKLMGHQDQITPNAFAINSKGQIEEKLTGTLEALGIKFKPATEKGVATSSITWGTDEGTDAAIEGYTEDNRGALVLLSGVPPLTTDYSRLQLAPNSVVVNVISGGEQTDKQIIDDEGNSSFLQLTGNEPQQLQINIGQEGFSWQENPQYVEVEHGLGRTPQFAIATLITGGSIFTSVQFIGPAALDETTVTFLWECVSETSPVGGDSEYQWVAIG